MAPTSTPGASRLPPRDLFLVVLVAIVWGVNFIPIRWALDEIPPFALSGLRFLLAAVPMVFFVRPPRIPTGRILAYGLAVGVFQFGLLFLAIRLGLAAGLASLLMQMQMFFTMALAAAFTGDRIRRPQVVGAAVSFVGLGVLAWTLVRAGAAAGAVPLVLVLFASFAWAVGNILAKATSQRMPFDMFALVVWSSLVAPLPLAAVSFWLEGGLLPFVDIAEASPRAWASVLFMAYAATLVGYGTWNKLLQRHSAGLVAPFTMIVPIAGLAGGVLVLHEALSASQLLGALIILAGIGITFARGRRTPRMSPAEPVKTAPVASRNPG